MHGGKYRAANSQTEGEILIIFFKTKPKMPLFQVWARGRFGRGFAEKQRVTERLFTGSVFFEISVILLLTRGGGSAILAPER